MARSKKVSESGLSDDVRSIYKEKSEDDYKSSDISFNDIEAGIINNPDRKPLTQTLVIPEHLRKLMANG